MRALELGAREQRKVPAGAPLSLTTAAAPRPASANFGAASPSPHYSPGVLPAESRMHDTPKRRENDHQHPGAHGH